MFCLELRSCMLCYVVPFLVCVRTRVLRRASPPPVFAVPSVIPFVFFDPIVFQIRIMFLAHANTYSSKPGHSVIMRCSVLITHS